MKKLLTIIALLLPGLSLAQTATTATVTLTWTASSGSVSGYNIYEAATQGALTALPNTLNGGTPLIGGSTLGAPTDLTYTFTNVTPGTYWYAVTAWYCPSTGACLESGQSAAVDVVISAATPVVTVPGVPGTPSIKCQVVAPAGMQATCTTNP
jgi:hypothetical protein